MLITFNEAASWVSKYGIIRLVNGHPETTYQGVRLLQKNITAFAPDTIYIGETSQVPAGIHQRSDIGLILINDCNFDFSLLHGNTAELPPETDISDLFNAVLEALNTKRKIIDGSAALLNCLVQGKGLEEIIHIGSEILGKPISLVDYTGKLLVSSDQQGIDLTPEGYLKQETYSIFRAYNFTKKVNESAAPILLDINHPDIPRMIVGKISIRNKIVGHLAVLENEKPFADEDIEVAKVLIEVIASEVQKNNFYLLMAGIHHEYFILDLLQEKHDNPTTVEDRVRSLQWDAYNAFHVVTINIPRNDDAFFFVEYFRTRLGYIFPFSKSIYYDENVILVIYKDRNEEEITRKLDNLLLENNLAAGISQMFSSIIDLKRYYEQARQALSIGKLLKKGERVFLYDDLYLYDLLTILNRHTNLKDFCNPGIDLIIKFDEANGTDYYNTLFEFVMGNANLSQIANKLHIHRNTLYHRIKKISEITGMILDNSNDHLKLLLSFKIMELYNISTD
jgi:sugar diacid utilization regulator